MALKKKSLSKSTSSSSSSSGGLKAKLQAKQGVLNKVRKEKAGDGYTEDADLLNALGITKEKSGKTAKVQLRRAELKEVNDSLIFQINFAIKEGPAKGLMAQMSIWIDLDDDEQLEKDFKSICFALQKMGYETEELSTGDLEQIAEELTEEKPHLVIYVSAYKYKNGKKRGQLGVNIRVNGSYNPEESEEEDEEEEVSEEEDLEEEDSEEDTEEDTEEEEEEDEEEEEEEEELDPEAPETWVGVVAKVKPPKAKRAFKATIEKYVKRGNKLTVSATTSGKEYVITPDDVEELDV